MAFISVVTPCYNEECNVAEVYRQVKDIFSCLHDHTYEHIFIDNSSADRTVEILKQIASVDKNVKIIVNSRNFGHIRSPTYGILQSSGDAVITLVADLQDPPSLIVDFIKKWEEGYKVVLGIKIDSEETPVMLMIRKCYYKFVSKLSEIELTKDYTGFGLYDKRIIEILRQINDPYPYFRGLISDIGFTSAKIEYVQPKRKRGITKNNFYTLYDMAMLGITNHSKLPLRLATIFGFFMSIISMIFSVIFFCAKLVFWDSYPIGTAPIAIGLFLFSSVQLFFIGVVGEYVASIHTQVQKRPLVIERERINFD